MTNENQAPEGGPALTSDQLWASWLSCPAPADGEDDSMEARVVKFGRAVEQHARAALAAQPQAALAYQQANPLGGPAKVFRAMADAIEAGDSYEDTLRRYGYAETPSPAEGDELTTGRQYLLTPEYGAAMVEMAKHYDMSVDNVLRAAIRLYQAQRFGSIKIEHVRDSKLLDPDIADSQLQPKGTPVAWRDPSNVEPGQGCTYDKAVADKWPHIYRQPLYAQPVQAPAPGEPTELEQRKRDYARALDAIKGHVEYISLLELKLRELQSFKDGVELHQRGGSNSWYWLDDRENYLETMVASLPVVIRAEQLRGLLAASQAPAVGAETAMGDEMDRQLEEAWSENEELRSQLEEARAQPWPEWTTEILKTVREFSGYDGFDDASEGVNLPEEVRECLEALAQEAKPMATIGPAAVRAGYRGDVSVADFVCARLAQPAPAAQVLVNVAAVATIKKRSYDEGPEIEWLLEGGPYELAHDEVLLVADRPVTDDDGHGEVFIAASHPPVQKTGGD